MTRDNELDGAFPWIGTRSKKDGEFSVLFATMLTVKLNKLAETQSKSWTLRTEEFFTSVFDGKIIIIMIHIEFIFSISS